MLAWLGLRGAVCGAGVQRLRKPGELHRALGTRGDRVPGAKMLKGKAESP